MGQNEKALQTRGFALSFFSEPFFLPKAVSVYWLPSKPMGCFSPLLEQCGHDLSLKSYDWSPLVRPVGEFTQTTKHLFKKKKTLGFYLPHLFGLLWWFPSFRPPFPIPCWVSQCQDASRTAHLLGCELVQPRLLGSKRWVDHPTSSNSHLTKTMRNKHRITRINKGKIRDKTPNLF